MALQRGDHVHALSVTAAEKFRREEKIDHPLGKLRSHNAPAESAHIGVVVRPAHFGAEAVGQQGAADTGDLVRRKGHTDARSADENTLFVFSLGDAAGGTLGILIPPSIPMILYGSITGESVGKLFLSGIVPGVLMTFFFICYLVFRCRHMERQAAASWQERWAILKENIWGLFLPILVVGGIYTGLFTPTEAAAVGTFYSLIITFFVYRTVKLRDMGEILTDTVKTTSMIFAIMIGAMLFGFILTALQAPQALMALVTDAQVSRWLVFIGINIVLLALGCVLETVSIILITLPMLYPIVKSLGFDLIWFNVVMLINMELALITPPVGMNLFVIKGISPDSTIGQIIQGSVPFAIIMGLEIVLLCLAPDLATWLPAVLQ